RGVLLRTLIELRVKGVAGQVTLERVFIVSTGLANRGPVCQSFFIDDDNAEYYGLDAVVRVVDAKHAMARLDGQRVSLK
ncbi:GTP-binding protein, partial [Bordetella holmesii]|uniref:GTP-binding protein n=1 Tax=Bordetella holmesii TaxID=35814 RepID=UPI001AD109AA